MEIKLDAFRVAPGDKVQLDKIDPAGTPTYDGDKQTAKEEIIHLNEQLEVLQELLYAGHQHTILIILQGMDTCGKDGTIEHVFEGVNPQGVRVANFKVPTAQELAHDYLWRVHRETPGKGEIVIFNRSHYEDVLVVRVHEMVPEKVWRKRYKQINNFERTLAEEGTIILKFFLHISMDEQKQRLSDRLADPAKHWKYNPGDLKERALWKDYVEAYEDAIEETSTEHAPWYIIPADRKWFRNLTIASILVKTLKDLDLQPTGVFNEKELAGHIADLEKS
jgi:PPK2 family polyphosphate:nucleotide phosphotransferase